MDPPTAALWRGVFSYLGNVDAKDNNGDLADEGKLATSTRESLCYGGTASDDPRPDPNNHAHSHPLH